MFACTVLIESRRTHLLFSVVKIHHKMYLAASGRALVAELNRRGTPPVAAPTCSVTRALTAAASIGRRGQPRMQHERMHESTATPYMGVVVDPLQRCAAQSSFVAPQMVAAQHVFADLLTARTPRRRTSDNRRLRSCCAMPSAPSCASSIKETRARVQFTDESGGGSKATHQAQGKLARTSRKNLTQKGGPEAQRESGRDSRRSANKTRTFVMERNTTREESSTKDRPGRETRERAGDVHEHEEGHEHVDDEGDESICGAKALCLFFYRGFDRSQTFTNRCEYCVTSRKCKIIEYGVCRLRECKSQLRHA